MKGLFKKYYNKFNHPDKTAINDFPGVRTVDISLFDEKLYNFCFTKINNIIQDEGIGKLNPDVMQSRFHYSLTFSDTPYCWHYDVDPQDPFNNAVGRKGNHFATNLEYAGIIYLNDKVDTTYGTKILWNDEVLEIENIFNRLVIYPTTTFHTLNGTFGNNRYDSRMVITIFFNVVQ